MKNSTFPVCVLGAGHLAAAVRVQLRLAAAGRPFQADSESEEPVFILACCDFENAPAWLTFGERVASEGGGVLFACLVGDSVRVGPFVGSRELAKKFPAGGLTRSWAFRLSDMRHTNSLTIESLTSIADRRVRRVAQIGATLVVGELAKLLFVDKDTPLVGCVAEIDSPIVGGYSTKVGGGLGLL